MVVRTISTGSPRPPYPVLDHEAVPPPPLDSPESPRPEGVRVASEPKRPLSAGAQESFEFPDSLQLGASAPSEPLRSSSETERKDEKFILCGVLNNAKESKKKDGPEVLGERAVVKQETPQSDTPSPPPRMSSTVLSGDRPFAEFSLFFDSPPPPDSGTPSSSAQPKQLAQKPNTPPTPTPLSTSDRHPSIAESIASSVFEPGADLSSFDASSTRAYPGRRGLPAVGMSGREEGIEEESVPKTWEEELDQRAKVGAELQRRTEEAARLEREERLQAEFWEEERREQERLTASLPGAPGPPKPPKSPATGRDARPEESIYQPIPPPSLPRQPPANQPSASTTTEIYQIKHVNWVDQSHPGSALRRSPILLQNANGPCPLLALVNALILSTPDGVQTSLNEVLRLREQVSLELLLDAVFEELMARGGNGGLPDVGDLFTFLLTLHTGMNVNPRFLPPTGEGGATSVSGGFENTKEMSLYGAFKVPLVHGWLPEPTHPVLDAMQRRAVGSYEEAQTLLLMEEEIIMRLTTGRQHELSPDDQIICEDARIIREFLDRSKTQLTPHGLGVLKKHLKAGDVAILFRNDHFMTILGARNGGELVGLVTDMGFAGHEEVVFERMVDVQGRGNEFLSGDFRPVGATQTPPPPPPRQQVRSLLNDLPPPPPTAGRPITPTKPTKPTNHTQLDYDTDLALAMQLQEEEDDRHRRHRHRMGGANNNPPPNRTNLARSNNIPPPPPGPPPAPTPAPQRFDQPPPPYEQVHGVPPPLPPSQQQILQPQRDRRPRRGAPPPDIQQVVPGPGTAPVAGPRRNTVVGPGGKKECIIC